MQLKIGADPELFVTKAGAFHSSFGLVPGTKKDPHKVPLGAVQVDGMALEFNIDPAEDAETFSHNIDEVLATLRKMVPAEYDFQFAAHAKFAGEHMAAQPREALELGCDPDFNAYTEDANPAPKAHPDMRAAGGHVHLGWCEDEDVRAQHHFKSCCRMGRQLDIFLGVPSLLLDGDKIRRRMYGKAGAFRPKPYGMEYRTLSNFWVEQPELRKFIFAQTQRAFKALVVERQDWGQKWDRLGTRVIDGNDTGAALKLVRGYDIIDPAFKHLF